MTLVFLLQISIGNCQINNKTDGLKADSLIAVSERTLFTDTTSSFEKLESSINRKEMLTDIQQRLEYRKQVAIKTHDDITLARCLDDLMKIRDLRTEDTLYAPREHFQ